MDHGLPPQIADRFEIVHELGRGGMGVVYEVRDQVRGFRVALKTLRQITADRLYRLKREFRVAADLSHPNLVALYELFLDRERGAFTMELVRGVDVVSWTRPSEREEPAVDREVETATVAPATGMTAATRELAGADAGRGAPPPVGTDAFGSCDEERLRAALAEVADALRALHRAGIVHRDLKPSNVLVDRGGRAVLMDFGIATELASDREVVVAGTPTYMAPEQATGVAVTAAADWYSLGCLLYHALNGRVPFAGTVGQILEGKRSVDAVGELSWAARVPVDLRALCLALLHPRPAGRPSGDEVIAELSATALVAVPAEIDDERFVGRGLELARLREALRASASGSVLALVTGPSGIGKSSLVRRFIDGIGSGARVLSGRCHERETVPYKGFDSVIDELVEQLPAAADPAALRDLARVFPAVRRALVEPAASGAGAGAGAEDVRVVRQRAFAALRSLLVTAAAERPVVVWIDDLQWADADSIEVLGAIVTRNEAGTAGPLVIATRRDEASPIDDALAKLVGELDHDAVVGVEVSPFTPAEETELLTKLLGDAGDDADVGHFVAESGGIPLFLHELVRYALSYRDQGRTARPTFVEALTDRVDRLPGPARELLEAAVVAAEPTRIDVLAHAAGVAGDDREKAINQLRADRLGRITSRGGQRWLDTYHDRVREVLGDRQHQTRAASLHRQLAEALSELDAGTPDRLARHLAAAGEAADATRYLLLAAQQASDQLAFDRAAAYYDEALALGQLSASAEAEVLRGAADALACAGRGYDAYLAYRRASERADSDTAKLLMEQAADQLLRSGHVAESLDVLDTALRGVGARLPRSPVRAIGPLLYHRAALWLRGFSFEPREADPEDLRRVDLLTSVAVCLGFVDFVRGAYINERAFREALSLGDPSRVSRSLANWTVFRCADGLSKHPRMDRAFAQLAELTRSSGRPYDQAWFEMASAWRHVFQAEFRQAVALMPRAERRFTEECVGAEWERSTAWFGMTFSLVYLGEFARLDEVTHEYLREASLRSNAYARSVLLAEPMSWSMLRRDQPEAALALLPEVVAGWPEDTFTVASYRHDLALMWVYLYQGRHRDVLECGRTLLSRLGVLKRVPVLVSVANLALGIAAAHCGERATLRGAVRACRRTVGKVPRYNNLAMFLEGLSRWVHGDREGAMALLLATADELDSNDYLPQMAEGARYFVGRAMGGDDGEALCRSAVDRMAAKGARRPRRLLAMFSAPA